MTASADRTRNGQAAPPRTLHVANEDESLPIGGIASCLREVVARTAAESVRRTRLVPLQAPERRLGACATHAHDHRARCGCTTSRSGSRCSALVGGHGAVWFMWMGEVELADGSIVHIYKHRGTRRSLHLCAGRPSVRLRGRPQATARRTRTRWPTWCSRAGGPRTRISSSAHDRVLRQPDAVAAPSLLWQSQHPCARQKLAPKRARPGRPARPRAGAILA